MSLLLESYLVTLGIVLLASATLAQLVPGIPDSSRERAGQGLLAALVLVLGVAIAGRWLREAQGPFLTMYDVLLSNVFSLSLIVLLTSVVSDLGRAVFRLVIPLLLLLSIWLRWVPPEAVPLPATFENSWLWVHVIAGKVFLGLSLICAAAAILQLASRADRVSRHAETVWSLFFVAFILHTIMLVAGSAWAHTAWGRFWSWDTLETSTLATWLLIGATLHARVTFKAMSPTISLALVALSFVLAFLTFFGLPFLSIGPHKGFV